MSQKTTFAVSRDHESNQSSKIDSHLHVWADKEEVKNVTPRKFISSSEMLFHVFGSGFPVPLFPRSGAFDPRQCSILDKGTSIGEFLEAESELLILVKGIKSLNFVQNMEDAGVSGALIIQPINHKFDHSYVTRSNLIQTTFEISFPWGENNPVFSVVP